MAQETSVLFVEGLTDKLFFEHLFRKLSVKAFVKVNVPTDVDGEHDTKGAVFNRVPVLIEQMHDGQISRLGVVVDADLEPHGGGQKSTLEMFSTRFGEYGFKQRHRVGENGGYLFYHDNGLSPIGLWIMPDNEHDGVIEHFIKSCITLTQQERFRTAAKLLDASVQPFLFKDHHRIKAEVSGWLAWQRKPGQGIAFCIKDNLVDHEAALFKRLTDWLSAFLS